MNTTDLPPLLRHCVDENAKPVSFGEIKARAELTGHAERRAPARRRTLLGTAGAGLAAAGIAGGLVASQGGGGGASIVLTAATLKQMASASQAAMTSGQADVEWAGSGQRLRQQITFDGANWNDVAGRSISRVVNGQEFHNPAFTRTAHGMGIKPGWMLVLTPGSTPSLNIPDPRTLLSVLSPAAGFVADGYTTENGVRLEHLRATTPRAISLAPLNPLIASEPDHAQASALDLWVDPSDVVIRARITISGTVTVAVKFSQIGQPQTVTAPARYTIWGDGHTG